MVELLHELDRLLDRIPVLSLARVVGEVLELELHRAVLGQYGRRARPAGELALVAAVERDRRARQAGAMLGEGVEELVAELGRLGEEDLLRVRVSVRVRVRVRVRVGVRVRVTCRVRVH